MFKAFRFFWLACLLAGLACPPALADQVMPAPALNGPTGLVRIPSADIIPYKNFNVGADYGSVMSAGGQASSEGVVNYMMNLGAFHGLELGIVGGTDQTTQKVREGVFVNMKLSLSTGDEPDPLLLALGVENLFSYTQTDVYLVATKYFKVGPKLTFGFLADFPNYQFRPLGVLGLETGISNNLFLVSDLMAGETLFQVDGGIRYYLTPIFSINISGLNLFDGSVAKDQRTGLIGFSWANPF